MFCLVLLLCYLACAGQTATSLAQGNFTEDGEKNENEDTLFLQPFDFTKDILPRLNESMHSITEDVIFQVLNISGTSQHTARISGTIPSNLPEVTPNLKLLSLNTSRSHLYGSIPKELGSLTSLELLNLSSNNLSGHLPPELSNLTALAVLSTSSNNIHGPVPKELGGLKSLVVLDLHSNMFTGRLPAELSNLTSLREIDLHSNQLGGPVPRWLGNLTALKHANLFDNNLAGPIPPELGKLAGLLTLDLSENKLTALIPPELGNLTSLSEMHLKSNQLSGPIPQEFGNLTLLGRVSLKSNQLTGPIPPELGKLAALRMLSLSKNQFTGPIPPDFGKLKTVDNLDFSSNQLTGPIPPELSKLKAVQHLDLNSNQLSGPIPKELGDLKALKGIYFGSNQLSGPIPPALGQLTHLSLLDLSSNLLSGPLPEELSNLKNLKRMNLYSNQLSGPIPQWFGNLTAFVTLDLSDNQLSGTIPQILGKLTQLRLLKMWGNQFSGPIPKEFGQLKQLSYLRCSSNQLSGPIPPELGKLRTLQYLDFAFNKLSGVIPQELGNLGALMTLDLASNQLSGPIPLELTHLTRLNDLVLSSNKLSGPIPQDLGKLTGLRVLDLSFNQLSGPIPVDLGHLTNLETLILASNKFSGPILHRFNCKLFDATNNMLTWPLAGVLPYSSITMSGGKMIDWRCGRSPAVPRFKWPYLIKLAVSGNSFDISVHDFMWSLGYLPRLAHLDAQNTSLSGSLGAIVDLAHTGYNHDCDGLELPTSAFLSLVSLNLAGNDIVGVKMPPPPGISTADFSSNQLLALNPAWYVGSQTLTKLKITHNPKLRAIVTAPNASFCPQMGATELMANPLLFQPMGTNEEDASVECTSLCAGTTSRYEADMVLNISALCRCRRGWQGIGDTCSECPAGTFSSMQDPKTLRRSCLPCPMHATTMSPKTGYCEACRCKPGYQIADACSGPTHNSSCYTCPENTFADSGDKCKECPSGQVPNENRHGCMMCPERNVPTPTGSCRECPLWALANTLEGKCDIAMEHLLLYAIYFILVAFLVKLVLIDGSHTHVVVDVSLQYGKTILSTLSRHHLHCPSYRKTFPITLRGTCHPALDSDKSTRVCRAKAVSERRLELLDANEKSINERFDTSMGRLELSRLDSYLHRSWPIQQVPVGIAVALIFAVTLTFVLCTLAAIEVAVLTPAGALTSGVVCGYLKWRKRRKRTPLTRYIDSFHRQLIHINPKPTACPKGPGRAMRLDKLLETHNVFRSFIQDRNAYYLVSNILLPLTRSYKLSFAEVVGPAQADFFVSHFWGTSFEHFCSSLAKHAESMSTFEGKKETAEPLVAPSVLRGFRSESALATESKIFAYWICFCSNNQYDIANELGGGAGWQESSFYLTLRSSSCKSVCMVLDDQALPLTRSWCIFETFQALKLTKERSGFEFLMCTASGVLNHGNVSYEAATSVVSKVAGVNLQDAQASVLADKEMIDGMVLAEVGSFDAMNGFIRAEIREALVEAQEHCGKEFQRLFALLDDVRNVHLASALEQAPQDEHANAEVPTETNDHTTICSIDELA